MLPNYFMAMNSFENLVIVLDLQLGLDSKRLMFLKPVLDPWLRSPKLDSQHVGGLCCCTYKTLSQSVIIKYDDINAYINNKTMKT